jgi:predicted DNA-binding protein
MTRKILSPFELDACDVKALNEKSKRLQRSKSSIIRQLIRGHLGEIETEDSK